MTRPLRRRPTGRLYSGGDKLKPQISRFRLRQVQVLPPGFSLLHRTDRRPRPSVVRDLDHVGGRAVPIDHQAAVLAALQKIVGDRIRVGGDGRRAVVGVVRRQLGEFQVVDPDGPLAACAGGDGEFERRHLLHLAAAGRSPGELDLALLGPHLAPVARNLEALPIDPPDVLSAGIDQLELQIVDRRLAADAERDLPVRRQVEVQGPVGHGVARAAVEVEVELERTLVLGQRETDAVRRGRRPVGDRGEIVERARLGPERRAEKEDGEERRAEPHSLRLPMTIPST